MALLGQGNRLKCIGSLTARPSGNFATASHTANGIGALNQARARLFSFGDADVFERTDQAGFPHGARPPYCWALPQVAGAIKSYKSGSIAVDGASVLQLGIPFSSTGDVEVNGSAVLDVVLSITATGALALDGTISLSSVVGITATGSIAIEGTCSLDAVVSLIASGDVSVGGVMNIMTLQSFSATDAVVSGSTQEIIDGVIAGLSGQSGGLTIEQETWLKEVWQKEGLDPTKKVTITKQSIKIGDPNNPDIVIVLTGDLKNLTTLERQ